VLVLALLELVQLDLALQLEILLQLLDLLPILFLQLAVVGLESLAKLAQVAWGDAGTSSGRQCVLFWI